MRDFLGQRQSILIDFRPQRSGELVDSELVLQKLATLMPTVDVLSAGRGRADVFVGIGGLAAVPALVLAVPCSTSYQALPFLTGIAT